MVQPFMNQEDDPTLSNFIGEFTDELDGDVIITSISGKINFALSKI